MKDLIILRNPHAYCLWWIKFNINCQILVPFTVERVIGDFPDLSFTLAMVPLQSTPIWCPPLESLRTFPKSFVRKISMGWEMNLLIWLIIDDEVPSIHSFDFLTISSPLIKSVLMRFVGQLTFLAAGCLAVPLVENHVVHEHQGLISRGWKRSLKLDGDVQVPVRIGLKQNNIHKSYQLLMDV